MLPATPTLPMTNRISASCQSPRSIQNIPPHAAAPSAMNSAKKRFFAAEWSARACPFLNNPDRVRRTGKLPEGHDLVADSPGFAITRNPGVTALIDCTSWTMRRVPTGDGKGTGILFNFARIENVSWMQEGRRATSDEVLFSIETGLPALIELAEQEFGAMPVLARQLRTALNWVPDADTSWYSTIRGVLAEL